MSSMRQRRRQQNYLQLVQAGNCKAISNTMPCRWIAKRTYCEMQMLQQRNNKQIRVAYGRHQKAAVRWFSSLVVADTNSMCSTRD
jgi:hypothetical protein